jgi:hypothetical protein
MGGLMMSYLTFTFWFTIIHTGAYILAGVVALKISKDIYESKERYADFLRDMGDPAESRHVQKTFIPAQLVRGIIMSLVLYPVLEALTEISFLARFFFFAGLMFVYTEISSSVPFPTNIEGFVYMKQKFIQANKIWKFWLEIIIYSIIFALPTAGFLF